ncbi:hypothetical protein LINGRAHAP2_LOCUS23227 [Linum grandiflorum]
MRPLDRFLRHLGQATLDNDADMMNGLLELVVHHGSNLNFSSRDPEYLGGTATEVVMEYNNISSQDWYRRS